MQVLVMILSAAFGIAAVLTSLRAGEARQESTFPDPEPDWGDYRPVTRARAQRERILFLATLYDRLTATCGIAVLIVPAALIAPTARQAWILGGITILFVAAMVVFAGLHRRVIRRSKAREKFACYSDVRARYRTFDNVLASFAAEEPEAYRIARASILADARAAAAEHERQMEAYTEGLKRLSAS